MTTKKTNLTILPTLVLFLLGMNNCNNVHIGGPLGDFGQKPLPQAMPVQRPKPQPVKIIEKNRPDGMNQGISLEFLVQNKTLKKVYVCCFAYIQKQPHSIWRWSKTPVLTLEPNQTKQIQIESVYSKRVAKNVYGYLGVFDNSKEAVDATIELLPDEKKLDLDLVERIGKNVVTIDIVKYSAKSSALEVQLSSANQNQIGKVVTPELDFTVENNSGKTVHVVAYVYSQDSHSTKEDVWEYHSTVPVTLAEGQATIIDISTIENREDAQYVRGTLGVFDEDELELAKTTTYKTLPYKNKVELDRLWNIAGKTITLKVENYGIKGDSIDFVVKTPTLAPFAQD